MKPWHAVLALIVVFVAVSAVCWQVWANPIIDGGREMNTPLRLLRGENLYSQVYYLYGPVAPFANALLYRLLGIHLNTLYAAGLAGSLLLVLMIFHLGRGFMTTYEAMLAAAAVMLFSVFRQGGNLVFPYSYSALYGTLLGTLSLVAQADYIRSRRMCSLVAAGALSGLAVCCKLEFGFAAIASMLALALSAPRGERAKIAGISLGACALFPLLIYGLLFSRIPAESVIRDTFLIPGQIPAELIHFNKIKLGLSNPGRTLRELVSALALLGGTAGVIALAGMRMAGESIALTGTSRRLRQIWWMTLACWGLITVHILLFGTNWDMNPFRALPIMLLGMTAFCMKDRNSGEVMDVTRRTLLILSIYSLIVLARVILRVPAGGSNAAGYLPVPMLLFVYMAIVRLPAFASSTAAGHQTRRAVSLLLLVSLVATLGVFAFRQNHFDYRLQTPRGGLRLRPALGLAMNQALDFIGQNSKPGEYILAFPEGSSLNFLADRPMPLRYEIITPGFLTDEAEQQAIQRIQEKNVRLVFLFNRPTSEFGPKAFGQDYCRNLMGWIDAHYTLAAVFGDNVSPEVQIGDPPFFIKCYKRK